MRRHALAVAVRFGNAAARHAPARLRRALRGRGIVSGPFLVAPPEIFQNGMSLSSSGLDVEMKRNACRDDLRGPAQLARLDPEQ